MKWLWAYLLVINIGSFLLFGIDKWKATYNKWRIRESTLIGIAVIGGSIGSIFGVYMFRHKTRHLKFTLGLPLILIVQAVLAFIFYNA